jgi:hypothetical protein
MAVVMVKFAKTNRDAVGLGEERSWREDIYHSHIGLVQFKCSTFIINNMLCFVFIFHILSFCLAKIAEKIM